MADDHPVFAVPFSWESAAGHLVELVHAHVAPSVVIEVGAGRAPSAERLRQRGFEYLALVETAKEADDLAQRGFRALVVDLADPEQLGTALEQLVADSSAPVGALLLVDVVERVHDPDGLLRALRVWSADHAGVLLGACAANIAHRSVALSLMSGRFRPLGAGPHHHTRDLWAARLAMAGFAERHRLDLVGADVKPAEVYDPVVSDGAQLGAFLVSTRDRADAHADTVRFVSLFEPSDPVLPEAAEPSKIPLLTVVAPDDRGALLAAVVGVSAVVVTFAPDDDLGDVVGRVDSPYVTFVDGDERFTSEWVSQFVGAARRHPGAIVRCAAADDGWPARDNQYGLLLGSSAPSAAFAIPTAAVRSASERPRLTGGRTDLLPLLLEIAPLCGIVDSGVPALAVPDGWQRSADADVGYADHAPYLGPPGSRRFLADLLASHRSAHARVATLEADNATLRAQLGRRSVALALSTADGLRRLRARVGRS